MNEGLEDMRTSIPSNDESPEVAEPSDRPFDLPSFAIASQRAAVLTCQPRSIAPMRRDLLDAATRQAVPKRVAVVGPVEDQSLRPGPPKAAVCAAEEDTIQRVFGERDLRRAGGVNGHSQRNTLAVCQYHKLCALPTFRRSDAAPPFFAGMNVPSRNASLQSSRPCSSSSPRKARQMVSHTPSSVHSFNRRQQVLGLG